MEHKKELIQKKEIDLRMEEFKWQKQKFLIMLTVSCAILAIMITLYITRTSYSSDILYKNEYLLDEVKMQYARNNAIQEDLFNKIEELEVRVRNMEDYSKSLKNSIVTNQELVKALNNKIEQSKRD